MKIQLKNIRHSELASHETNCYQGVLYLDGKRAAIVSNEGQGGADRREPLEPYTHQDLDTVPGLETTCHQLVVSYLIRRDYMKLINKKVVTVYNDQCHVWCPKKNRTSKANLIKHIKGTEPDHIILNTLPEDEALEIFKKVA